MGERATRSVELDACTGSGVILGRPSGRLAGMSLRLHRFGCMSRRQIVGNGLGRYRDGARRIRSCVVESSEAMITSTANPRVVEARKLHQRKQRLQQDRFMIEGLQLLRMAIEQQRLPMWSGKIRPCELFYCRERLRGTMADRLIEGYAAAGATAIAVSETVVDSLSSRDASQGAAATLSLGSAEWSLDEIEEVAKPLGERRLLLVLDRPQNPGNVGTLIRTADAVGASAVVLLEPCVDPFDPGVVRSSMGSALAIPVVRLRESTLLGRRLAGRGFRLVGADGAADQTAWDSDALDGSVALVLGNEANGLGHALCNELQDRVSLPLLGRAESLNVSVAGGILMYEWLRLRVRRAALAAEEASEVPNDRRSRDQADREATETP